MKAIISLTLILFSLAASADQSISCYEINRDGSPRVNGASLKATLVFTSRGSLSQAKSKISMKGVWKKGAEYGKAFTSLIAEQSKPSANVKWAHLFFNDAANGEMVEYQLQFKEPLFGQTFSGKKAVLVIGMENNSTEYYPNFGHDLKCSGRVN